MIVLLKMDKKKNFESYAKSLFGKAFGKKKSNNPLSNDADEDIELDDDPAPFTLRSGPNAPLFTISSRRPFQTPDRDATSTSQLHFMFDSTEINDLEDESFLDTLDVPLPDFSQTQPNDVLVDGTKTQHDSKRKSKTAKTEPSLELDMNANIYGEEQECNRKHQTPDKEMLDSKQTKRDKNKEKSDKSTKLSSKKTKEICDNTETLESSENKKAKKGRGDKRNKNKSLNDLKTKSEILVNSLNKKTHGTSETEDKENFITDVTHDLPTTQPPATAKTKPKRLRTGKSRLEKQNSERDDSGISLNEGDDIFFCLGDDVISSNTPIEPRSGSQSGQNSRSDSDCDLSYFCVDHMKMCTSRAELSKHRKCQLDRKPNSANSAGISSGTPGRQTPGSNQRTIRVLSSADKSSSPKEACRSSQAAYIGMVSMHSEMLEKLYNYAGVMIEDREKSKAELQRRKEAMEEWIMDYVQEIVAIILKFKERVMPQLEELHSQTMEQTTQFVAKLHQIRHESLLVWQTLQVPSDFNDFEKYRSIINDASHQTHELVGQLEEKYDSAENMRYEFEFSPEIQRLKETETIASVGAITGIPSLPPFLTIPGEKGTDGDESNFTSMKSLDSSVNVDGNQAAKNSKYCFTGCAYILADSFVMADWAGGMIKMISKYSLVSDSLKFEESPWDVVQTCTGQVAVTVPRMRTVYFVEAEPHLKVSKRFSTGCQCFGICKIGDRYAMTCDPWSRAPSMRVFDAIGNTLLIVDKDSIGENIFKCPLHICSDFFNSVFYVSDSSADCVYSLSPTGEIIFCYEHNELDYPAGIATDRNNYLYICGRKSANIHKISNMGELSERFIQRRHGVCSPCAIAFHPDGDHMILSDLTGPVSTGFWKARLS